MGQETGRTADTGRGDLVRNLTGVRQALTRHRRMIGRSVAAAASVSLGISLLLPKTYTAKTMILPAQEEKVGISAMLGQFGNAATLAGFPMGGPSLTDLYLSMLKSEAVKDPVIDRMKLMERYQDRYRADTYRTLDRKVVISAGKKDGIITVTAEDHDPKRAAALANAYVEELGRLAVRLNVTGAGQNRVFLEQELRKAKADLAVAEENLKSFQTRTKAVQVSAQAEATIKGLAELTAQIATQEVELATLRRQYTESSREVKNRVTSLGTLRIQLARLEGAGKSGAIPAVGTVPGIGQEHLRLTRDLKIQESLVEVLTRQYELARYSEAKNVAPFQVILEARVPEQKSRPARGKIVVVSTAGALVASCCLALVLEGARKAPANGGL